MTKPLTRSQKIENLYIALTLLMEPEVLAAHQLDKFEVTAQYTSLIGPNITVRTPQYTGVVTVDFEGSVVRFDTYGYRHRFADMSAFLSFLRETLKAPLHAAHKLAGEIGAKTMGNSIILAKQGTAYYIEEIAGGWNAHFNNQSMYMSYGDIVGLLGA